MTDKERIEVYVNKLPKCCEECPCCNYDCECGYDCSLGLNQDLYDVVGKKSRADGKTFISIFKYETLPDGCPLKTLKDIQNQKAVEALARVKELLNNEEFMVFRTPEMVIEQLIKEYGGKE